MMPRCAPPCASGCIDHLLLSPSLKSRLVAGGVAREVRSWEKTSDHAPAWIELKDVAQSGSGRERGIDGEEA
jgi:endonuclease/exonuclease/phosphatase family metal-dependent hydrolase